MEPADFYGICGASFTALRLRRDIGSELLHGDDPDRLCALAATLSVHAPPEL
jgi:hypothetical protein